MPNSSNNSPNSANNSNLNNNAVILNNGLTSGTIQSNDVDVYIKDVNIGVISGIPSNTCLSNIAAPSSITMANNSTICGRSIQEQMNDIFSNLNTNDIKHENENLNLYLKAIVILLNQKGITITENEIKDVVNSIKVMNKLMGE